VAFALRGNKHTIRGRGNTRNPSQGGLSQVHPRRHCISFLSDTAALPAYRRHQRAQLGQTAQYTCLIFSTGAAHPASSFPLSDYMYH
jgi:hypothetical protein